ncbi:AAA15 family ATPase/GTPase [Mobiluncus mulieris]|uniref:Predicted ATPase n=1 Tax=Mobiluncus mulieris TaxID=2052 RepID=A0A8G2HT34_9ACTO|nr:ATP-binding protein [Mobiluncus mulieris]MBB5847113.1 AAA15 family ATPase/GTPase [Mobiluncus mulieris]STO16433.1 Predicted ATPase [Mobiluncus mulieris]
MRILFFSVKNFRSVDETQTIDFVKGRVGGSPLVKGGWEPHVRPVTILMGPNAAGKSNVIDAMGYVAAAMAMQVHGFIAPLPYMPFMLVEARRQEPSEFEFDFLHEGVRYRYYFAYGAQGVEAESLYEVNNRTGHWNKIFEREVEDGRSNITWRQGILNAADKRVLQSATSKELVFPFSSRLPETQLASLSAAVASDFVDFIPTGEVHQDSRRRALMRMIKDKEFRLEDASRLLNLADTGITSVALDEKKIPAEVLAKFRAIRGVLEGDAKESSGESGQESTTSITEEDAESIAYNLVFTHQGREKSHFTAAEESDGTLSWLAYAPSILRVLRTGGVLVADELDASLHQRLVEVIVRAFTNPQVNVHQAQLVFSSHNTNFLEYMEELGLEPESFWFVEKSPEGASQLYPLDSFETHKNANYETRYRGERYGAIPNISEEALVNLVQEGQRPPLGGVVHG